MLARRVSIALAIVCCAGVAQASPSAKLVYIRAPGTEACPAEDALRKAVASRLGYDPFFPSARKTVIAHVTRTAGGFQGKVQLVSDEGALLGERDLSTRGDDCGELVTTMALAVSIAIDDLDDGKREPEVATEPAPRAPPEPEPTEPDPPPKREAPLPPAKQRMDFSASLGPTATLGGAPTVAIGGSLAATIGYGVLDARVSARADLPASKSLSPAGTLATRTVLLEAEACLRGSAFYGCAGVGVGTLGSESEGIARPASDRSWFVVPVATIGARVELAGPIYLEPFLDGSIQLAPQRIQVDGRRAYTTAPLTGTLGIHVGMRFL